MTEPRGTEPAAARSLPRDVRVRGPDDVAAWCDAHQIPFTLHRDLDDVHTVDQAAAVLGVDAAAVGKTVVFDCAGTPVAVIAPGTAKVRDGAVAKHVGVTRRNIRLADPESVVAWTGYPVGGVPPGAFAGPVRPLLEETLVARGQMVFGGGSGSALLVVDVADLDRVLAPEHGRFVA